MGDTRRLRVMTESDSSPVFESGQRTRRLLRSRRDRVIGGVCGGLGRYLNVDPVLLRIAAVALALSGGVGVLAYLVAWVLIPEDTGVEPEPIGPRSNRHATALVVGAALIALGALLLVRDVVPWFNAAYFWPLVVVGVGLLVLTSATR